jgi:hypothetical protein
MSSQSTSTEMAIDASRLQRRLLGCGCAGDAPAGLAEAPGGGGF